MGALSLWLHKKSNLKVFLQNSMVFILLCNIKLPCAYCSRKMFLTKIVHTETLVYFFIFHLLVNQVNQFIDKKLIFLNWQKKLPHCIHCCDVVFFTFFLFAFILKLFWSRSICTYITHSSEKRGLCLMKWPSKML